MAARRLGIGKDRPWRWPGARSLPLPGRVQVVAAAGGLLLSRAVLLGTFKPFGVASLVALGLTAPEAALAGAVGVVAGTLLPGAGGRTWPYVAAAVLLAVMVRHVARHRPAGARIMPLFAGAVLVATRCAAAAWSRAGIFALWSIVIEGILAVAGVYVMAEGLPRLLGRRSGPPTAEESACLVLIAVAALAGVPEWTVAGMPVRQAVMAWAVISLAAAGGVAAGGTAGIVVGAAGLLLYDQSPGLAAAQALAGLVAGFLRELGRWACGVGYVLARAVVLFAADPAVLPGGMVLADIAGYALSSVWPLAHRWRTVGRQLAGVSATNLPSGATGTGAVAPREQGRDAVAGTHQVTGEDHAGLEDAGAWERAVSRLGDFGNTFSELAASFQHTLVDGDENADASSPAGARRLVLGQMKGLAAVLDDLTGSFQTQQATKANILKQSRRLLGGFGIRPEHVHLDGERHPPWVLEVQGPGCPDYDWCQRVLLPVLEGGLGARLQVLWHRCALAGSGRRCAFTVGPAPRWQVRFGAAQVAADGTTPGDSFACGQVGASRCLMAISDGMGIGPAAARESRAAVTLVHRLLSAGLDVFASLRAVNSLLILGAAGDTFATLDLCLIDVFTGQAEFAKISAPPSYLVRGGRVQVLAGSGLPLGMLDDVRARVHTTRFLQGDLLVMASDGLWSPDGRKESWVIDVLAHASDRDPQALAELLAAIGRERSARKDDITVLVGSVSDEAGDGVN